MDGGIFREGVNVYVTYRKLPESCQHWCQAMKASIQKTCSWYAASGKCAILTGCTNFVDKNDIWSASCTPVILKFPINNTTGPITLYFGINIQNSDISGPKNTSGIKILNSNFQVLTDGPAGFTKTTSVINDGNILLSSTALGAIDVSALVSFSLPGDFSRLTNGKIVCTFHMYTNMWEAK